MPEEWTPEYGEVVVYQFEGCKNPKLALFEEELMGGFYKMIENSGQNYLEKGSIPAGTYHKRICRKATTEEVDSYIALLYSSKFNKNILLKLNERNIELCYQAKL